MLYVPKADPSGDHGRERLRTYRAPSLLICHEDELVAEGLAYRAERYTPAEVEVGYDLDSALLAVRRRPPGFLLCSEHFVDGLPISAVVGKLQGVATRTASVMIVTRRETPEGLAEAGRARARCYVSLDAAATPGRLAAALLDLFSGLGTLPESVPAESAVAPPMTRRELEVLDGFDRGLTDRQIADRLGVTIPTVRSHARNINRKLMTVSRAEAAHRARELDLL